MTQAKINRLPNEVREVVKQWERDCDEAFALGAKARDAGEVEMALRANNLGGLEFVEDHCRCDASVGMSPCEYCAIDSVLRRVLRVTTEA